MMSFQEKKKKQNYIVKERKTISSLKKMTINRQYDHKFKLMMLGDAGVGKTSIARCDVLTTKKYFLEVCAGAGAALKICV